jgi:hypothetical protein
VTNQFKNVVLSPQHSQALLHRAEAEGLVARLGARTKNTISLSFEITNSLAQQAIDSILSHDKIILTGVWAGEYDFSTLESEDLFAAEPVNWSSAFKSIGNEIVYPSPQLNQIAERSLILEPLLLKWFWNYLCNYPEYSKKIPKDLRRVHGKGFVTPKNPEFYDFLKRMSLTTRRHVWRLGMLTLADSSVIERNEHLLSKTYKWGFKDELNNFGLVFFLRKAYPVLWELFAVWEVLATEHYIQTARQNNACMMHGSKSLSYELLGQDEVLYRIGQLKTKGVAAVRFQLNAADNSKRTQLSLKEALQIRKHREIQEFRKLIEEITRVSYQGQGAMLSKAAKEVTKATQKMSSIKRISQIAKVTTYLSLPIAIAETLLSLPPIAGLALSGTSTIVTYTSQRLTRHHSWVSRIR